MRIITRYTGCIIYKHKRCVRESLFPEEHEYVKIGGRCPSTVLAESPLSMNQGSENAVEATSTAAGE
jgi:hypothetical protein